MDFLVPLIKVVHLVVSIVLILIILVQPSKSGDIGSMFGGGNSESVFGSVGAVPFLVKLTRLFAFVFIVTSLSLGYFSVKSIKSSVVEDSVIEMPAEPQSLDEETGLPEGSLDSAPVGEPLEQASPEIEIDTYVPDSEDGNSQNKEETQ